MRTGLYKRLSNEELVELYKAGESDAFEALLKNTEGLRATLAQRYLNIPGSEFEDLMSEGAIEMLSAIQNFDSKNYSSSFSTFLYSAISRHYNDMFTAAVCEKRNPGCFVQSYEQVNYNSEYEEDGDSLGSSEFSVVSSLYSTLKAKCGSENVSVTTNTMMVSQSRSFLWNLLLIICTGGLWLIWMLIRKRKEKKVTETWATCQDCGKRWKVK